MSVAKCDLAPPKDVTLGAKSVMGAIDFDPYSTNQINTLVEAARFYDRELYTLEDIVSKEWDAPLQKRAFIGAPAGAVLTRRLLNKTLKEYRKGNINQAILWLAHNEALIRSPWIWDFPVCIPFKRLRPCWYDDELDVYRTVAPADWSAIFFLPPPSPPALFHSAVSRFNNTFNPVGRIVFNEYSGDSDWEKSYKVANKKPYNYHS
ncbi:MAG: hypothetical protein CMB76_06555 [Euryarchaeota archaeon]|nr:hypothetical protein [Euryarchaeota archaeon]|tara:strand:- start:3260 stop:3877 length:618 start_codon:yes stop_codon:yes gene_type:complete